MISFAAGTPALGVAEPVAEAVTDGVAEAVAEADVDGLADAVAEGLAEADAVRLADGATEGVAVARALAGADAAALAGALPFEPGRGLRVGPGWGFGGALVGAGLAVARTRDVGATAGAEARALPVWNLNATYPPSGARSEPTPRLA